VSEGLVIDGSPVVEMGSVELLLSALDLIASFEESDGSLLDSRLLYLEEVAQELLERARTGHLSSREAST
jgi:hypothetical protein